jgi:hypothetical protein
MRFENHRARDHHFCRNHPNINIGDCDDLECNFSARN